MKTNHKIAIARALSAIVRGAGMRDTIITRRGGVRWELDLREGIDFAIFLLGAFERRTVAAYRKEIAIGATVLDIGANIGAHTLHFARCVGPRGRVIAFEPTSYAFEKLLKNIALNPELAPRITPLQLMLVASAGAKIEGAIYSSWPLSGDDPKHPQHGGRLNTTVGARAETLDAALAAAGVSHVDFIKIDVDGHECEVLRGAERVLSRDHPRVLLELAPYLQDAYGGSIEELCRIFAGHGYKFYEERTKRPIPLDPSALREQIPEGSSINAFAEHT